MVTMYVTVSIVLHFKCNMASDYFADVFTDMDEKPEDDING